ncbi:MAG TPA: hypothetical protein VF331_05710 [Polyangiales bacterium]
MLQDIFKNKMRALRRLDAAEAHDEHDEHDAQNNGTRTRSGTQRLASSAE